MVIRHSKLSRLVISSVVAIGGPDYLQLTSSFAVGLFMFLFGRDILRSMLEVVDIQVAV